MKAVVVGGSGMLGRQLVTELLEQGHDVVSADVAAFPPDHPHRKHDRLRTVRTDITNPSELSALFTDLHRGLAGGKQALAVFWLAAAIDWRPLPCSPVTWQTNVGSVKQALRETAHLATARASVGGKGGCATSVAFVYVSTMDVCADFAGPGDPSLARDDMVVDEAAIQDSYTLSKRAAELEVLGLAAVPPGLRTTVLRLSHLYGPGDVLVRCSRGTRIAPRVWGAGRQQFEFVSAYTAAHAVRLAGERLVAGTLAHGQRMLITEEDNRLDMVDYVNAVRGDAEPPMLRLPLPLWVWMVVGLVGELVFRLGRWATGRDGSVVVTRFALRNFVGNFVANGDKARRLLGFKTVRSRESVFLETRHWYAKQFAKGKQQ